MRSRPILLSKTCPYCGARSIAEAKLPTPTNITASVEYNLDNLGALVEAQSLNALLALVELLPYKTFVCRKCQGEFRLESTSTKELVHAMLTSLQPVIPARKPTQPPLPRRRSAPPPKPRTEPVKSPPATGDGWDEPESLDQLFDYSIDNETDSASSRS